MKNFAKINVGGLRRFMYGTMAVFATVAASAKDTPLNDYDVSTNAVVARRALPADSCLSVAYPISRDYTTITKRPQSGDEVREVRLYRKRDDKKPSLIFAARTRKGVEERNRGILDAMFSPAPKAHMRITLSPNANSLSSTHDRMLTLSAPLREPSTMDDGSLRYAFNFSIPLY